MSELQARGRFALVTTGIEGLDDILGGGLPAHRLFLVEGDPGTGKTTLALQFLREGIRQGEKSLYVTLSETEDEVEAVAESHGWSLDGIRVLEMSPSEDDLSPDAQNTMFHPSELEFTQTTREVLAEVERLKPDRLVFDSMSELRLLAQDSLRYRRQVLALKKFFAGRKCTVILLDNQGGNNPDNQLRSIVHGVVSLERRSPDYGVTQRRAQVVKLRGQESRAGYHDFVIRPGGIRIFPRLIAAEHDGEGAEAKVTSGIDAIDQLLGGGIERGSSTLLLGPAGVGKSAIATQYAVASASRGEKTAIFTFEETRQILLTRTENLGQNVREYLDAGTIGLQQVDPAQLTPGEFAHIVRQSVERDGVRLVVIDSLNGYLNAMPEMRFLLLHLHELLTYLGQQGVTVLLIVAQHGLVGNAMTTPVDASYLADTVILYRFFEALGEVRQAISVVKKRNGSHERTIRELRVEAGGIKVGEALRDFEGILTGVPRYAGSDDPLLGRDDES